MTRWERLLTSWFVVVQTDRVNLDDVVNVLVRPGSIVRCTGDPREALQVHVMPHDEALGCVGGMISDEDLPEALGFILSDNPALHTVQ